MPVQKIRPIQEPCKNCRDRHLKCNKQTPKCGRCDAKSLDCFVVPKRQIFRQGSTAHFSDGQPWVSSKPKRARLRVHDTGSSVVSNVQFDPSNERDRGASNISDSSPSAQGPSKSLDLLASTAFQDWRLHALALTACEASQLTPESLNLGYTLYRENLPQSSVPNGCISHLPEVSGPRFPVQVLSVIRSPEEIDCHNGSEGGSTFSEPGRPECSPTSTYSDATLKPLESVQEACLLRYFIEELSPWFDVCDDGRHFQVAVP
ncbi:Zn(II)2Cys6 transcription factor domain-containing protein [Aspergillus alliaceus]|uniref:Zn(II)2Cys6 transcription factor domain-containing protein n=1 Tax=Petromyces alliaceus TaxID=209559 RepID=UPI0012A648C9|nr:uncharacterized protein BDW43DRAFT_181304 [Aspergillus alliaceus]KAB8237664.1 hypothetical protein BDW43DRAFT_181304 [Aspergillus alliaceus]